MMMIREIMPLLTKTKGEIEMKYEVREIDAWMDADGWAWNTSYFLGTFETRAKDEKRAFCNYLKKTRGIVFKKNRTRIFWDGDVYEICDRKTGEPLFAAIPA